MAGTKPNFNNCVLALVPDRTGYMYDMSPYNNHAVQAVAANQPTLVNNGLSINKSLDFDGVNDYLRITDLTTLNPPTNMSVSILVNPDETQVTPLTSYTIINIDVWYIFIDVTKQRIAFRTRSSTPAWRTILYTANNTLNLNVWNQISCHYNDNTGEQAVYINGDFSVSNNSLAGDGLVAGIAHIDIGGNNNAGIYTDCDIQYIFMFNYALDAQEHLYMDRALRTQLWSPQFR